MHATIAHYQRTQTRRLALTLALALAILGALVLDMATGPSGLTWDTLIRTLLHPGKPAPRRGSSSGTSGCPMP
ncbi:hypothetical protein D555_0534 [Bordetella holmesii 35009]|nr:hypothetical protein D555_0534 [Bordetella holmesii 35009]